MALTKKHTFHGAYVTLFKESGKYYTEEYWDIPEDAVGPWDLVRSKDFHRIGNGSVYVKSQEPWGFPHLITKDD